MISLTETPKKIAAAADAKFTAQVIKGRGMMCLFGNEPTRTDDGLIFKHGERLTRDHGTGDVWAWALPSDPGFPPQSAWVVVAV